MILEQVKKILGKPYQIKVLVGLHNFECKHPNPGVRPTYRRKYRY